MNGFLVMLRHTMDDLPLRLCATKAEAHEFAAGVHEGDDWESKEVLRVDSSTPLNVSIYEFVEGKLVKWVVFKEFAEA